MREYMCKCLKCADRIICALMNLTRNMAISLSVTAGIVKKTLRHESTTKINFATGDYAFTHEQFRDQKMTFEEVIDYIAAHDKRKVEIIERNHKSKRKSNNV